MEVEQHRRLAGYRRVWDQETVGTVAYTEATRPTRQRRAYLHFNTTKRATRGFELKIEMNSSRTGRACCDGIYMAAGSLS
jgi:hypothetical protein